MTSSLFRVDQNLHNNCVTVNQARKRHININFFVRLVPVFTGFVPGTNPVCPWDKSGEKLGQTQECSLFYTVEARFHRACPWDKPSLSQGQSRGRRAAQKVYCGVQIIPYRVFILFELFTVMVFQDWAGWEIFTVIPGNPRRTKGDSQHLEARPELQDWLRSELIYRQKITGQGLFRNN